MGKVLSSGQDDDVTAVAGLVEEVVLVGAGRV